MTTNEVLEALGLRSPPPTRGVLPSVALFTAGLVTGAVAAAMLAPRPGRELRQEVAREVGRLGETVRQQTAPALHEEEVGARPPSRMGPNYSASPTRRG